MDDNLREVLEDIDLYNDEWFRWEAMYEAQTELESVFDA